MMSSRLAIKRSLLFRTYFVDRIRRRFSTKTPEGYVESKAGRICIPEQTVHEYVFENSARFAERIAVECLETGRKYSYNHIYRYSRILSDFLLNRLKLQSRDTVAIILPNVPEYPIILLGCMQADLLVTTCNPHYTYEETSKQLAISSPKIIFTTNESVQSVKRALSYAKLNCSIIGINHGNSLSWDGVINFQDIISTDIPNVELPKVDAKNTALLPFSSGTTGFPKGVELTHGGMVTNLHQAASPEFNHLTRESQDVLPGFLPFFHIYGLTQVLCHGLAHGVKVISVPKFSSEAFVKTLRDHGPTMLYAVPPMVLLSINKPEIKPEYLARIRTIVCGAAPLGAEDIERFCAKASKYIDMFQAYGMTECGPLMFSQTRKLERGVKIGGCGTLVPNATAKIVALDDDNRVLGPNETGQILLNGPQKMKGYFNNPTANAEIFTSDGWIRTGDVGHYDEDEHFFVTDRLKELIKVKGFQVAPAELEELIRGHPLVDDVAVVGIPHNILGEAPKAFVVLKNDRKAKNARPEDIARFLSERVVREKQLVGGVVFIDSIPKTASGKLLRKELRKL